MESGSKRRAYATSALVIVTFALILFALVEALVIAPREATMGDIQRLFYFHMPSAWIALGPAFTVVFGLSIAYLATGKMVYDRWAGASAEIGVIFTTITLMTGPIVGETHLGSLLDLGAAPHHHSRSVVHLRGLPAAALHRRRGPAPRASLRGLRHRGMDRRSYRVPLNLVMAHHASPPADQPRLRHGLAHGHGAHDQSGGFHTALRDFAGATSGDFDIAAEVTALQARLRRLDRRGGGR